jgi:hypothetical protein
VPAVDLTEALPSNQNKKLTLGDLTQGLNPATTGAAGVVQLSTSTSSTSTTQAATPSAVKSAYDLANAAAIKPLYYRLNSTLTGSNGTSAQAILGVGVSLAASTVYEFEASFLLGKTAGTTSHHILFGFGGTATINNIGWQTVGNVNTTVNGGSASIGTVYGASATAVQATGTIAAATLYATILLRGTVSINGAGTFIPQYTLSAAPGGAYIVQPGSYMKVWALGASGSNSINGTWS